MTNEEVLDLRTDEGQTIREYLHSLLKTLWEEEEGFSGKRPFGNSGWTFDLYIPLIRSGLITGDIEDGYINTVDEKRGHEIIAKLIDYLCGVG